MEYWTFPKLHNQVTSLPDPWDWYIFPTFRWLIMVNASKCTIHGSYGTSKIEASSFLFGFSEVLFMAPLIVKLQGILEVKSFFWTPKLWRFLSDKKKDFSNLHPADGRNPAIAEIGSLSHYFTGFYTLSQVVGLGISEPSTEPIAGMSKPL